MVVELPVHVPCDFCSFSVIVRYFYRPYCHRRMILWGDTPFKVEGEYPRDCEIVVLTTSEFVKSLVSGAVEVDGVLHPAFNLTAYKKRGLEKRYWFTFIGSESPELGLDRKRIPFTIDVLRKHGKYKESVVVSNFPGSHMPSGMLS